MCAYALFRLAEHAVTDACVGEHLDVVGDVLPQPGQDHLHRAVVLHQLRCGRQADGRGAVDNLCEWMDGWINE